VLPRRSSESGSIAVARMRARRTGRHRSPAIHLEPEDGLAGGERNGRHVGGHIDGLSLTQKAEPAGAIRTQIRAWLEADPALSAASVLQRLKSADPSRFTEKSLRTVQKAVKAWRIEIAGQIIRNGDWLECAPVSQCPQLQ